MRMEYRAWLHVDGNRKAARTRGYVAYQRPDGKVKSF
jgi:hypothetical protein